MYFANGDRSLDGLRDAQAYEAIAASGQAIKLRDVDLKYSDGAAGGGYLESPGGDVRIESTNASRAGDVAAAGGGAVFGTGAGSFGKLGTLPYFPGMGPMDFPTSNAEIG